MKKIFILTISLISGIGLLLVLWSSVLAVPEPGVNTGITVDEGSSGNIISNAMLMVSDTVEVTYILDAAPLHGSLNLTGTPLNSNDTFTQSNIDNSLLTYNHDDSETPSTDVFTFSIQGSISPTLLNQPFKINILPVNDPPTANPDTIYVLEGESVNVTDNGGTLATNDTDPDSSTLTVTTTPIDSPAFTSAFTLGTSGSFNYVHDDSENFSDSFIYQICDEEPLCDTATATVIITPVVDIAPTLNAIGPFSIPENIMNGGSVGTVTATDVEVSPGAYDTLNFSITAVDPPGNVFQINNSTGLITIIDSSQINYETNKTYTLTVQVKDSGNFIDTGQAIVNITNVDEPPNIPDGQEFFVNENSTVFTSSNQVVATDPENDIVDYSIISGNPGNNLFELNNGTGELSVNPSKANLLDFETQDTYILTIRVEDAKGLSNANDVTITLNDINEPPIFNDFQTSINENRPNGFSLTPFPYGNTILKDPEGDALTFKILSGSGSTAFTINENTGQITVADTTQLNFEITPTFSLVVEAKEADPPDFFTDTASITININNINEAPIIAPNQSFPLPENSPNTTTVGTVAATDQDAADFGNLTYAITNGNASGTFSIDNNGVIKVADNSALDFEQTQLFNLEITVTDSNWDGLGAKQDMENVRINISNVNENPSITSGQSFTIVGFSPNGTEVGTVNADDPDFGDTLMYAIVGGNIDSAFKINSSTGKITVNNRDALDFDVIQVFNLAVRVTDALGLPSTNEPVVINLTEPPIYTTFIPLLLNNYPTDEPNDSCAQAFGIGTNTTYSFLPEDVEDWYKFTLTSSKSTNVVLSNYQVGGQIIAYRGNCGSLQFLQNNGNFLSTKTLNLGNLSAGTYFIRVVTDPPFSSTTKYNLIINTP